MAVAASMKYTDNIYDDLEVRLLNQRDQFRNINQKLNQIKPHNLIACMKAIHNSDGSDKIDTTLKSILFRSKSKEKRQLRKKIQGLKDPQERPNLLILGSDGEQEKNYFEDPAFDVPVKKAKRSKVTRKNVALLLESVPTGDHPKQIDRWMQMPPITIEDFDNVLKQIDESYSLDFKRTLYINDGNVFSQQGPSKVMGMRHKKSGVKHGIIREHQHNGDIIEKTYFHDTQIGLIRITYKNGTSYQVTSPEGTVLSNIFIGPDWLVEDRVDPGNFLKFFRIFK